ncbi:MAG TPA: glycosyltransferase family 4 protein [Terriglobales bacterium]|jgi:glycosyltransferase involved in cell wall biosynthesis|nr:glycosyltransferase family 4 protein [Terriglobales bacterium]
MSTSADERTRVLLIDSGGGYGGPSAFLSYLLQSLDRKSFQPFAAFYFAHVSPSTEHLRELGVPVLFLSRSRALADAIEAKVLAGRSRWRWLHLGKQAIRVALRALLVEAGQLARLLLLLRRLRIGLVVLNNDVHYHPLAVVAARLAGVPCICRKAGGIGEGKRSKRFLTPWVALFIAISEATARDQRQNSPGTKRVVTVYEGIDIDRFAPRSFHPEVQRELEIPFGTHVVGCVARVVEGKGHREFIEAAALVRARCPNTTFLIVGADMAGQEAGLLAELRRRVQDLGLAGNVVFAGWREDIPAVLSALDLFVHCPTTWLEGLGIAHLEAMAAGKPTVVSRNGGLTDAAVDGLTGFIVTPGDTQQMAEAIRKLLEDPALARRCGQNARRRVEELFDAARNTQQLEKYFREYALPPRPLREQPGRPPIATWRRKQRAAKPSN